LNVVVGVAVAGMIVGISLEADCIAVFSSIEDGVFTSDVMASDTRDVAEMSLEVGSRTVFSSIAGDVTSPVVMAIASWVMATGAGP
jgi:hypothetical protein